MAIIPKTARFLIETGGGESCEVDCKLEESACFKYGNGTQVVVDGELVRRWNWGHPMCFDTRYVDFSKCGGFEGFCADRLKGFGFTVKQL